MTGLIKMPEDSQKNHSPMIDCDCFMSKSGAVNLLGGVVFQSNWTFKIKEKHPLGIDLIRENVEFKCQRMRKVIS